jgi:putative ABC transport system substrate-binding protein
MKRREFIAGLAAVAGWPIAARSEQAHRVRRVGIVMPYRKGDSEYEERVQTFRQEMAHLGWSEGLNVEFDERWTTDNMEAVRTNAASLVASRPDAIVATGGRVIPILMERTSTIPIVVPGAGDAVASGYAASLARPGGNVTGFSFFESTVIGKMLDMLKQIAPDTSRVGLIYNPDNPNTVLYRRWFGESSSHLFFEAIDLPIHGLADIESAISRLEPAHTSAAFFPPDITINALRADVTALVARRRLPAIYSDQVFPRAGGLAFYGADRTELFRSAARYVDRIFRGESPGDLPFQQPTKYQLVINLRTAKAIGLDIPPTVLALADEVIE